MEVKLGIGANSITIGTGRKAAIARDAFDFPVSLPGNVRKYYEPVLNDPVEWACLHERNGAQLVTLHLISTDPNLKNTSPKQAAKTVSRVLDATSIPLIISGSGNPKKDPLILAECAKVAKGRNCLLSAVGLDTDYPLVAKAAKRYGHSVLALVSNDHLKMAEMVRLLMREGLPNNRIVLDPATGALGYGLEYTISTMEKIRGQASSKPYLDLPILSASSNAWSAREAWLKNDAWGPRDERGFLWESITAVSTLLAGANLFMMLDPNAIELLRWKIDSLPHSLYISKSKSHLKSIPKILSLLKKNEGAETAIKLLNRKLPMPKANAKLSRYLAPCVNSLTLGSRTIGGEDVLHRHELRFFSPPPLLIFLHPNLSDDEISRRISFANNFSFERMGKKLKLDGVVAGNHSLAHSVAKKSKSPVIDFSKLHKDKLILLSSAPAEEAAELFTRERLKACKSGDGKPCVWLAPSRGIESALDAAILLNRYASLIILDTIEPSRIIPLLTLRENLYADPLAAPSVKAGLYKIGEPTSSSPLLITTNFALTYYTVSNDIRKTNLPAHLLVLDTGGYAVGTSLALGRLSGEAIAKALAQNKLAKILKHKTLVLPGLAASLQYDVQKKTGWKVLLAPSDSSQVGDFLKKLN